MYVWSWSATDPGPPSGQQSTHPLEEKVQIIGDFLQPTTQHKLHEFLGLINFYHRFLPNSADTLHPLNKLLSTSKGNTKTLLWSETATAAFATIKEDLANATLLSHPKPDASTSIMTDASDIAVGAVLRSTLGMIAVPSHISLRSSSKLNHDSYTTFDQARASCSELVNQTLPTLCGRPHIPHPYRP